MFGWSRKELRGQRPRVKRSAVGVGLEIEAAGAFTVALNADHTRLLRAWREEPEPTKELELQPDASSD